MAQYTRSITDQFPAEDSSVGWLWHLLIFAVIVFAATLFLYFGIEYGYKGYLNGQISSINKEIQDLSKKISITDQQALISFYSQIFNIQVLLRAHNAPSGIFTFLESTVTEGVYYTSAVYDDKTKAIDLAGMAASYEVLAKQLESFKRNANVSAALLNGSSVDEAQKVQFTIRVLFNSQFLATTP